LWRAIGGTLMWLSHVFFAYNMYKMIKRTNEIDVKSSAIQQLEKDSSFISQPAKSY